MNKRDLTRSVRFTCQEWETVLERAHHCGLPPATFMRQVVLGAIPRQRRQVRTAETVYQLARIGNNLNQLAKSHNSGQVIDHGELSQAIERLNATIRRI